jgi:hypothetical protein
MHKQLAPSQRHRATELRALADPINAAWRDTVQGIFKTGDLLLAAKKHIAHGHWRTFIKVELAFDYSTAVRLMDIAGDARLRNVAHAPLLPPCWTVLYRLTNLTTEQFHMGIDSGIINPGMERWEVEALRVREPQVEVCFPNLFPAKKPARSYKLDSLTQRECPITVARRRYFEACAELTDKESAIQMDLCEQFFILQFKNYQSYEEQGEDADG